MKPCSRVGIDVTWKCQWRCQHCFYLRNPSFHAATDVPIKEVTEKIRRAKANGLDHVVMVGYGEPSLCANTPAILDFAHSLGMATSMITNGATGLSRFQGYFAQGLDHLHISSHGLDGTLDEIVGVKGAFAKQAELKEWLRSEEKPFRTNATLQKLNYRDLPDMARYEVAMGVHHFVFLGFLPHYEWRSHAAEIAVHPADLRPYIEDAADILLASKTLFTIRYHPLCYLAPRLWPYVVNARYVAYDPWEWNYALSLEPQAIEREAIQCGEAVANRCEGCLARRHCGGWNRVYAEALNVALHPITKVPAKYAEAWGRDGGLYDMNPANRATGTIQQKTSTEETE